MSIIAPVTVGVVVGTIARVRLLRMDYRQFPSYPQGYATHITLGFVAAFLGAIAPPAIVTGELAAASFLALAATQFREVRTAERETLRNMEETELVRRGPAYIEGIARVFEARNYAAMLTGLLASLAGTIAFQFGVGWSIAAAVGAGALTAQVLQRLMGGKRIGDIADVTPVPVTFEGPVLTIDGVSITNVGWPESRRRYLDEGIAVKIVPHDADGRATLANLGQRQAIAHETALLLGVELDVDEPEFIPVARQNPKTGVVVMAIVPLLRDETTLVQAVEYVPVLDGASRKPVSSGLWPPQLAELEQMES